MKDSQQMSVEISNQNNMALTALPPVSVKENLFPVNPVDEDILDEDFHLHLSEDENEEKNDAVKVDDVADPQENEDDILDKFAGNDKEQCNGLSDKLEDKVLDSDNSEETTDKLNGEIVNSDTSDKANSDSGQNEDETQEEINARNEEEQEKAAEAQEKVNAELLEDQIMDTEHLLQIVDKDQEDAEYTKDSCSSNSENSRDKSEETEVETEGEKNDNAEEESESIKADNKDIDEVDIEENSLSKDDGDIDVDKEYENIVNEKDDAEEESKQIEGADVTSDDSEKEPMELGGLVSEEVEAESEPPVQQEGEQDAKVEEDEEDVQKTAKRPLIDAFSPTDKKKTKYSESETENESESPPTTAKVDKEKTPEPEPEPAAPKIQALNIISEFMQKKTMKKLTREDLEEICLMKMCEAICHKSEIGELRHQLGVQEQMVDMWRKEAAQLTKQARDLEIVNKRLLHEVRLKNERDKPLIPVKITRSVGLQVRSDNNVVNNIMPPQKRRFNRTQSQPTTPTAQSPKPTPTQTSSPQQQPQRFTPKQTTPISSPNANKPPTKIITANKPGPQPMSKPKNIVPKSPASLLSKALQNSTVAAAAAASTSSASSHTNSSPATPTSNNTPTTVHKSQPNQTTKTIKTIEPKIIDLTDEDDKKPTPVSTASTTLPTPQGVRIVSTPVKPTNTVSSATVVNPPRIMYVYNNQLHQGLIADSSKLGTQKLMLKLNSNVIGQTNGVIAVSNGSTLAVTTANIRTSQVQPVRLSTPVTSVRTSPAAKPSVLKHPAPLPPPPITQMSIAARKPIPPKPHLSIRRSSGGIVLSWKMPYNLDNYESIASYQLYAYQETTSAPSSDMWRKVGDVKALALPMACTLTQFADGNKYHFAVRAVDVQKRMGPFSDPEQILL